MNVFFVDIEVVPKTCLCNNDCIHHATLIQYRPVTNAHMRVIFRVVPCVFAIVIHVKLKPWSMTMSGYNPRMV